MQIISFSIGQGILRCSILGSYRCSDVTAYSPMHGYLCIKGGISARSRIIIITAHIIHPPQGLGRGVYVTVTVAKQNAPKKACMFKAHVHEYCSQKSRQTPPKAAFASMLQHCSLLFHLNKSKDRKNATMFACFVVWFWVCMVSFLPQLEKSTEPRKSLAPPGPWASASTCTLLFFCNIMQSFAELPTSYIYSIKY